MLDCRHILKKINKSIAVTSVSGNALDLEAGIKTAVALVRGRGSSGLKVFIIGNGGSAAIASHVAADLLKNARVSAIVFNDASLLTCISNDLGYKRVFEQPIATLANRGDLLIAISSSGKSQNILNACRQAKGKGCALITLSGFGGDNPLRKMGELNFYVSSRSYGYVEVAHMLICHTITDILAGAG